MVDESLVDALRTASRVVAFSGAGMSTESGVPDFRSPGGIWTRYDPREFTFDRYVDSADVRARSWQMRREFFDAAPQPNPAHDALVTLERDGRLAGVITQNIDGLHQQAGSQYVVELHGTARDVQCIGWPSRPGEPAGCGWQGKTEWAFDQVDLGVDDPTCPVCDGLVKSATISFGQMLDRSVMEAATELVEESDLLLTVGSSLQVYPAASLPELAVRAGSRVAIINDEPTGMDHLADVVVRARAAEVLPNAVAAATAHPYR
ncbi:MAG TPA: Sir2 family NAD-dependent protein deacetylase [Jiangellaceae bacterium]|nr:Sir2 family NAD-dependent protein deacetylase [Jiangellaceae bacterium]